ncbi:hypothetical protein C7S18_17805 [Ahniella affigens]|uniref:Uncharacterized protein n=1 Tax=Ahniella affigens TaxID=2021234 RepID=A0A2P1PVS2_9GAMM|nr:hypothetical protein [Ahniella affigens]AVP98920.1 hypothetical protein C7S18_17805 [Ahniella affigens]
MSSANTAYTFSLVNNTNLSSSDYSLRVLGFSVASALFLQDNGSGALTWSPSPAGVSLNVPSYASGSSTLTFTGGLPMFNDILLGDTVTGPGIASGTTVTGIAMTITLSQPLTATASGNATINTLIMVGGTSQTTSTSVTGLVPPPSVGNIRYGQAVSGSGIATGTTVSGVTGDSSVTLSTAPTAGATFSGTSPLTFSITPTASGQSGATNLSLSNLASVAQVAVGNLITGTGIPANTTIASINNVVITLSSVISASQTNATVTFTQQQTGTWTAGSLSITGLSSTANVGTGGLVTAPGIAPGTTIAAVLSGTSLQLSTATTAAGSDQGANLNQGTVTFPRPTGVIPSYDISAFSSFVFDPVLQPGGLNGARIYLFVVPNNWPAIATQPGFAGFPTNPPGFPFSWAATGLGIQQPNTPPNSPNTNSSFPPFSIVEPTIDAGATGLLHIDVQTVDGFTFPLSLVLLDVNGNQLGQVGQPVPAGGITRGGIIAAFQQTFAANTAYGALLYGSSSDIDNQYPGVLNPGAYLADGANSDSSLASLWDTTLTTLYGSGTQLNMVGDDGNYYQGLPTTVGTASVLQFTGYTDTGMTNANGNVFNLYSPKTPDPANTGVAAGYQVIANAGVYADTSGAVFIKQTTSYTVPPSQVALGLQRDIVSAINRGIALKGPSGTTGRTAGDTSAYWGTETNWYPEPLSNQQAAQNQFSLFMHTATSNGQLIFTAPAGPPVAIAAAPTGATASTAGSTTTATLTTTSAHGLVVGDWIAVQGVGVGTYNGNFQLTAVPTTTSLSYTLGAVSTAPAASGGGSLMGGPAAVNKQGTLMGQAYGFAYDESPVHGPLNQPNVPSKFDPAPTGTVTVQIVFGPW